MGPLVVLCHSSCLILLSFSHSFCILRRFNNGRPHWVKPKTLKLHTAWQSLYTLHCVEYRHPNIVGYLSPSVCFTTAVIVIDEELKIIVFSPFVFHYINSPTHFPPVDLDFSLTDFPPTSSEIVQNSKKNKK